jgi:hypothetical protein
MNKEKKCETSLLVQEKYKIVKKWTISCSTKTFRRVSVFMRVVYPWHYNNLQLPWGLRIFLIAKIKLPKKYISLSVNVTDILICQEKLGFSWMGGTSSWVFLNS